MKHYTLNGASEPVREKSLFAWARWMAGAERRVAYDMVEGVRVSTVFLGLDHDYSGMGPPVLWETMVFGGRMDQHQERCAGTREQAEAMHAAMVGKVRQSQTTPTDNQTTTQ